MFQMANTREQCSWVHTDYVEATKKAKALVRASVNRVVHHEALEKRFVDVNPATLVIGGGIFGLSAALEIADSGKEVFLVEKTGSLGGLISNIDLTFPYMHSARQMLTPKINHVQNHPHIDLFMETEVKDISGYVGNFETILTSKDGKDVELKFGNIVVATGLKTFDPGVIKDYGYGKFPDVITSVEFEKMLLDGKILTKEGNEPKNIAIIHCVGSRNKDYHEYCSRVCCMTALKYSKQIRSALPKANIYEAYADMRSFGKNCEEFYLQTSRKDVMFMMFDKQDPKKIKEAGSRDKCKLLVELNEKLCGTSVEVPADMVILMVAMEAYDNVTDISHAVGISMCGNDFYIEKHPKLDPVAQARAAAARILATIAVGSVEIEPTTAIVNEDICCGCQTCIKVCPYTAISFDEEEGVSVVNEILCKGCGTCSSACPTGAIRTKHFTDQQILSQIEGLLSLKEV
ncbi:Ion-translocating oxidoreductase complex subunit B [subsurface metagenome]